MSTQELVMAAAGSGLPNNSYLTIRGTGLNGYYSTVDSSGNIYSVGDYGVGKFDVLYSPIWVRNTANTIRPYAVAVSSAGDVYVCGRDIGLSYRRAFLAKYNSSGVLQWSTGLSQSAISLDFTYVCVDANGVYVTGFYDDNAGTYYGITAKYNTSGTLQWQMRTTTASTTHFNACTLDSSGNLYVCGKNFAYTRPGSYIVKLNSSGTELWGRTIYDSTGNYDSHAMGITTDSSENVYVNALQNNNIGVLTKFNSSGTNLWKRDTGTLVSDLGIPRHRGIAVLPNGNVCCQTQYGGANGLPNNVTGFLIIAASDGVAALSRRLRETNYNVGLQSASLNISGAENIVVSAAGSTGAFTARFKTNGNTLGVFGAYTYENPSTSTFASTLTVTNTNGFTAASTYNTYSPTIGDAAGSWTSSVYQNL